MDTNLEVMVGKTVIARKVAVGPLVPSVRIGVYPWLNFLDWKTHG
jgi:hypothetical protein